MDTCDQPYCKNIKSKRDRRKYKNLLRKIRMCLAGQGLEENSKKTNLTLYNKEEEIVEGRKRAHPVVHV